MTNKVYVMVELEVSEDVNLDIEDEDFDQTLAAELEEWIEHDLKLDRDENIVKDVCASFDFTNFS